MKKFIFKVFIGTLVFGLTMFRIYYIASARNGLTASQGDSLTADKWNELVKASVPSGAVMAFNLSNCPIGWSEYIPAYGRFIRGIDKSGTNIDPDGQRVLSNIQLDGFQGHVFEGIVAQMVYPNGMYEYIGPDHNSIFPQGYHDNYNLTNITNIQSDGINGNPRIAKETRPKNVALLYCIKN